MIKLLFSNTPHVSCMRTEHLYFMFSVLCCAAGGVAHARSVPGHATSGDARVSRPENYQETESQGSQKRLPAGDPADLLWSSARLSGQDEQRRPSPGNSSLSA